MWTLLLLERPRKPDPAADMVTVRCGAVAVISPRAGQEPAATRAHMDRRASRDARAVAVDGGMDLRRDAGPGRVAKIRARMIRMMRVLRRGLVDSLKVEGTK